MKYVIVSLVEMKREMNTSDNIEWMRLRVSVCAWDWCGARARGLINSLHTAPPVDVTQPLHDILQ